MNMVQMLHSQEMTILAIFLTIGGLILMALEATIWSKDNE